MSEVHIIAVLSPKKEKVERCMEIMKELIQTVHSKEDYTLRYLMTQTLDSDNPEYVMIETYKDEEASNKHTSEPHFQEVFSKVVEESLLAKEPWLVRTKSIAGWEFGRELI